jgi:ectoine hydroxylase-related dioxygenase (phytanoyl-CoA dioxygenase family)
MSNIDYEFERYIATPDNVKQVLNYYGVAIIPNILNEEECNAMNNGMWETLEHITQTWDKPIKRDNPESWRGMQQLYPKHSMLLQHWSVGHSQYVWNVRQNPKVVEIFAKIWECEKEDLLVSFDGVSYSMPPEQTRLGWYKGKDALHCDQSYLNSDFLCVQGWINGYDTNEGDASLSILESSSDYHKDFQNKFKKTDKADWCLLTEEERRFYEEEKICLFKRIKCPKGSLVLWDSRTIHCGSEALKTRITPNFRNITYVCYEPRSNCTSKDILKKQKAFENMRIASHWPCKTTLFPKLPRTYGNPLPDITDLPEPKLSELGRKLAGF